MTSEPSPTEENPAKPTTPGRWLSAGSDSPVRAAAVPFLKDHGGAGVKNEAASAPREVTPVRAVDETEEESSEQEIPEVRQLRVGDFLRDYTRVEKLGLATLLATVFGVIAVFFLTSIFRLPKEQPKVNETDFPIQGKHVRVTSARTYWKVPVPGDDGAYRRGTVLLPEIELSLEGGPGVIRALFRDGNGVLMGDSITRDVADHQVQRIAATAGFEDYGMYSAYRTGGGEPWTIEVFESANRDGGDAMQKLFVIQISTELKEH